MAVDHVEGYCKFRKLNYNRKDTPKEVQLKYDSIYMETNENRKKNL